MEGNVTAHPEKRRDFDQLKGAVAFEATDIGQSATLTFAGDRLVVANGIKGQPALVIRGESAAILELSNLKIGPFGLPLYTNATGRSVLARLLRRELRIDGLPRHVATANRLTRLFSVQ